MDICRVAFLKAPWGNQAWKQISVVSA